MTNTIPTPIKLGFSFYTTNAKKAYQMAKKFYNKSLLRTRKFWSTCLKKAWDTLRAEEFLNLGKVVFVKKGDTTVRTANILPVRQYTGYDSWSAKYPDLFMAIDADKLKTVTDPKLAIISFYTYNVIYR